MQGKGDRLARGDAKATFQGGYGEGELKPSIAPESDIPAVIDNSALFAPKRPSVYYRGKPFNKRILITQVELESNSDIIIPDSAKAKSEVGRIVQFSDDSDLKRLGLKEGCLILFDRFAAIGQSFKLLNENGESVDHVLLQEADVQMEMTEVRNDTPSVQ
jgi:co-chaperonin GroES (HSP10)